MSPEEFYGKAYPQLRLAQERLLALISSYPEKEGSRCSGSARHLRFYGRHLQGGPLAGKTGRAGGNKNQGLSGFPKAKWLPELPHDYKSKGGGRSGSDRRNSDPDHRPGLLGQPGTSDQI